MTTVRDALSGVTRLGIDTSPVIYFSEADPRYDAPVEDVFRRIAQGGLHRATSVITLGQVLVQPYARGDAGLREAYRDLLLRSAHFQTLPIDAPAADRAAGLRARFRLRMPDALQIAVAIESGCEAFLTNDRDLRRVGDLRILVLDELEL